MPTKVNWVMVSQRTSLSSNLIRTSLKRRSVARNGKWKIRLMKRRRMQWSGNGPRHLISAQIKQLRWMMTQKLPASFKLKKSV